MATSRRSGCSYKLLAALVVLLASSTLGCATYRDDLDRAMGHYNANEYDKSLALLEVLEIDLDSLSTAQRAQYEYYRGMAHFRINQKYDARHWLGRSAAREKADNGSLSADEKDRLDTTLAKLNQERYGDAEIAGASCTVKEDCSNGQNCMNGSCVAPEGDGAKGDGAKEGGDKADQGADKSAGDKPTADKPAADK